MAYLHNDVYDKGLTTLTTYGTALYICSTAPTTYAEATTLYDGTTGKYSLGSKTSLVIPAPSTRTAGGREVVVPAVTDGAVTATGTATYYAIVDPINSKLLAVQSLTNSQVVTSGNVFTLTSYTIGIPSPA